MSNTLKYVIYVVIILGLLGLAYFLMRETGVFATLTALLGVGAAKFTKQAKELSKQQADLQGKLNELDKQESSLKSDGVPDKSDKDEVDYWKKQK